MARSNLWEYVVLYHPKTKKDGGGNDITDPSKIIVPVGHMLAVDNKEVGIKASRMIPKEYDDKLDDCDIKVRPF